MLAEQPHVPSDPHFVPHPPQLFESVAVFTSQPSVPNLLQSLAPAPHGVHTLFEQYCDAVHAILQPPQLFPLFVVFVSQPLPAMASQSAVPRGQASTHEPDTQIFPALQAMPHIPQCMLELAVLVSQPLALLPSQLPNPASQPVITHVPVEHDSVALA
jgi:hypothetical protein